MTVGVFLFIPLREILRSWTNHKIYHILSTATRGKEK